MLYNSRISNKEDNNYSIQFSLIYWVVPPKLLARDHLQFFGLNLRLLKSQSQLGWSHLHFTWMSAVHIIFICNSELNYIIVQTRNHKISLSVSLILWVGHAEKDRSIKSALFFFFTKLEYLSNTFDFCHFVTINGSQKRGKFSLEIPWHFKDTHSLVHFNSFELFPR